MSAKTSAQPGRRTPLSLSGTATKNNQSKGGSNSANDSSNNANSHTTSNNNKQDNKLQQRIEIQVVKSPDSKENPNKKLQLQSDKKTQQNDIKKSNERGQSGASSIKQSQPSENKQQQQIKDKQQQKHGSDEKGKKEKSDKLEKQQDRSETKDSNNMKDEKKIEQEKCDHKNEDKKAEKVKDVEEKKNDAVLNAGAKLEHQGDNNDKKSKDDDKQCKTEHLTQMPIENDKKSNEESKVKNDYQKAEEKMEYMEIVEEEDTHQGASITHKSSGKVTKTSITVNKTPTKENENSLQKSAHTADSKILKKREETTTIDDDEIEMQPLIIESSPTKTSKSDEVSNITVAPSATSTPGKIRLQKRSSGIQKSDVQLAIQTEPSPTRPRAYCEISGRRSIRPISDYTPSKFQSNLQYRESYRRINTELDVSNTSMNVTVGSEVPNNLSFSFFGRGRKRDRTPQRSQSAVGELQSEIEVSPPKKARLEVNGFLSAFSSPLLLLRNRFSKASLQSSTPVKLQQKLKTAQDDIEVQNVSGETVLEEVAKSDKDSAKTNALVNSDTDATLGEEAKENISIASTSSETSLKGKDSKDVLMKSEISCGFEQTYEQSDIQITETLLYPAVGDPMAKNKRCTVM